MRPGGFGPRDLARTEAARRERTGVPAAAGWGPVRFFRGWHHDLDSSDCDRGHGYRDLDPGIARERTHAAPCGTHEPLPRRAGVRCVHAPRLGALSGWIRAFCVCCVPHLEALHRCDRSPSSVANVDGAASAGPDAMPANPKVWVGAGSLPERRATVLEPFVGDEIPYRGRMSARFRGREVRQEVPATECRARPAGFRGKSS